MPSDLKEILNIEVYDDRTTEVTIRVPGFHNFGEHLGEIEQKASETPLELDIDESTKEMLSMLDLSSEAMRKRIDAMPDGLNKQVMMSILKGRMLGLWDEDDAEQADEHTAEPTSPAEESFDYNLHQIRVLLPGRAKWGKAAEARIDKFLLDWPKIRPRVLKAIFRVYKEVYGSLVPDDRKLSGGLEFTMPKPTNAEALADLFCIETIYLHRNGDMGLSGHCTWDEEHGWGILIRNGIPVAVGQADEAFN